MLKHVSFVTADADAVIAFYTGLGATVSKDLVTGEGFRRLVLSFGGGGKLQFFELPQDLAPEAVVSTSPRAVQTVLRGQTDVPETAQKILHPARPDGSGSAHAWMEHVALQLPDLHASLEHLKAQGVTFSRELTLSPSGNPVVFVLDPDGRQVELLQAGSGR